MSESKNTLKTLVAFSGKQKDWREWSAKFMAQAQLEGFWLYLMGTIKINCSDSDYATLMQNASPSDPEKLKMKAYEANAKGFASLLLSVKGIAFIIVKNSITHMVILWI